jgi:hypothetical protein
MSAEQHERKDWRWALGAAEPDPPSFGWRPLRAILAETADASAHLWSTGDEEGRQYGTILPAAAFDARVEEGHAVRFPAPIALVPGQVIVRDADGVFAARDARAVAAARASFVSDCVRTALEADARGAHEDAACWLDHGRLAEDWIPLASVLLAGLVFEHRDTPWAESSIDSFAAVAPSLDIELVRQTLTWDDLPHADRREELTIQALRLVEHARRPVALSELEPLSPAVEAAAETLLAAHRLFDADVPALGRLSHRTLARLLAGNPAEVQSVVDQVRTCLRLPDFDATVRDLDARLAELGADAQRVRSAVRTQLRRASWTRLAAALGRVEATLGDATRLTAWRAVSQWFDRARPRADLAPWRAGESAAETLRAHWLFLDDRTPRRLGEWARQTVGLATLPAAVPDPTLDGCHVVGGRAAPAAFLDRDRVLQRGPTTRFAVAKALGFNVFADARSDVAWLSHAPDAPHGARRLQGASETEQAANGFAAYFLAPRHAVCAMTRREQTQGDTTYATAVAAVMRTFGLSFPAAFAHVANCHDVDPPFEMRDRVGDLVGRESTDDEWRDERVPVPEVPAGTGLPPERADGFASLLARGIAEGRVGMDIALRLLGGEPDKSRALLEQRVRSLAPLP